MISKTCVVRVLLNSHQLDYIVPCFFDSRQVIVSIITVGAYTAKLLCHSYMRLVDSDTLIWLRNWFGMFPFIFLGWIPPNTIEKICFSILNLIGCPSRISIFSMTIFVFDIDFVFGIVRDSRGSIWFSLDCTGPLTKIVSLSYEFISVPAIKVSEKGESLCIWAPLIVNNIAIGLQL